MNMQILANTLRFFELNIPFCFAYFTTSLLTSISGAARTSPPVRRSCCARRRVSSASLNSNFKTFHFLPLFTFHGVALFMREAPLTGVALIYNANRVALTHRHFQIFALCSLCQLCFYFWALFYLNCFC